MIFIGLLVSISKVGLSHESSHCSGCRHLGLLRDALAEVSGGEGCVALGNHPCRKVWNKVQTLQRHYGCRHQVAGGEEGVLEVCSHGCLARRDCREVVDLYAKHYVEEQQHVEPDEV